MENRNSNSHNISKRRGLACALLLGAAVLTACAAFLLMGGNSQEAPIIIPQGCTAKQLSDSIKKYTSASYARKVMFFVRLTGGGKSVAERRGLYVIAPGTQPFMAARKLLRGGQTPVRLTINDTRTLDDLTARVASRFEFSADSLRAELLSAQRLDTAGHTPDQARSIFLNNTYEFYRTDSPAKVIGKLEKEYSKFWTPERRKKATALGLTPDQMVTLASIVDEETNSASEKGRIGRLYINRLQKGMRLQADPTVKFAVGDFEIKRITAEHLAINSAYNTYRNAGLPPGPIRTTTAATIDAILDSRPSADLYMCAAPDFSGKHLFASTFAQHTANAARYRAALDANGIK